MSAEDTMTIPDQFMVTSGTELPLHPPESLPVPPGLTFDAAVPRYLVHRASIAEVFVTGSRVLSEHTYQVAAQLPRGHAIAENPSLYDFQILVETVRQAGVLVAHTHLGVDVETPFIFRGLQLNIRDLRRLLIGTAPGRVLIHTTVEPERTGAGRLRGLIFRGSAEIDGKVAMEGEGRLLFITESSYRALRRRGRDQKLDRQRPATLQFTPARPDTVGRTNPRNVVITEPTLTGERRHSASLVVDSSHPYLFDHPLDHVPGNLSVEACRQAAVAAVSREYGLAASSLTVVGAAIEFGEFAELDLITRVTAEVGELAHHGPIGTPFAPVTVTLTQAGTTVASADVQVAAWTL